MSYFPAVASPVSHLFSQSLRYWYLTARKILPLIIGILILQEVNRWLARPPATTTHLLLLLPSLVLEITFWVMMVYVVYRMLKGEMVQLRTAVAEIFKQVHRLVLSYFLFLFCVAVTVGMGYGLGRVVIRHFEVHSATSDLLLILLIGFPVVYVIVLLMYAVPNIVIEKIGIWCAWTKSIRLCYFNWFRAFAVYLLTLVFVSLVNSAHLLPAKYHWPEYWQYLGELVVWVAFIPFLINFYTFMLNDLRIRSGDL